MADEIDIEEHDILTNPRVADIYMQLPNIKTEPVDYEEHYDDYDIVYDRNVEVKVEPMDCYTVPNEAETMVTSPEPTTSFHNTAEPKSAYRPNRIILGSKPCPRQKKIKPLFVLLEDWGERLRSSPCFCKECKILFATRNALDAHKMGAHSFLVAVDSPDEEETPKSNHKFCTHCNTYFEDENLLIQHLYDLIKAKQAKNKEIAPSQAPKPILSNEAAGANDQNVVFLCCKICTCYFKSNLEFDKHRTNLHGNCDADTMSTLEGGIVACIFCGYIAKTYMLHNRHIRFNHKNIYLRKSDSSIQVKKPKILPTKVIVSKAKNVIKRVDCNIPINKIHTAKSHQSLPHGNQSEIAISKGKKLSITSKHIRPLAMGAIPKKILFKCSQCPLHFLTCVMAISHASQVDHKKRSRIPVWECPDCHRLFRAMDKRLHQLQHKHTREFEVSVLHNNIYSRVLCRCAHCDIYFEERLFVKHMKRGCSPTVHAKHCSICNLKVNSLLHAQKHNKLKKSDFILINEFIQTTSRAIVGVEKKAYGMQLPKPVFKKVQQPTALVPKKPSLQSRQLPIRKGVGSVEKTSKLELYYCNICKVFVRNLKKRTYHTTRKCRNKQKKKGSLCGVCGLHFSSSGQQLKHKNQHLQKNIHLKDYSFLCIRTLKPIIPPVPEFFKCMECGAQFINNHSCESPSKKCKLCKQSFTDLAFRLHILHHKYFRRQTPYKSIESTLEMKYRMLKPTWNVLYNCSACDVTTDSYDDVVMHSQKHFNHVENYDVIVTNCHVCSLNFEEKCYKRHSELHENESIDRSSFTILKYDYYNLLTDDWLKIFDILPKEQVAQILSRSIYVTRTVRMTMLQNGPPECTIYKCQKCDKIVAPNDIAAHTEVSTCSKQKSNHKCHNCGLLFATEEARDIHLAIHEKQSVTANSFRVVAFNNPDETEFNAKLRSECKLSVKPAIHKMNKLSDAGSSRKITRIKYKYYQCQKCYCCISKLFRTYYHVCASEENMSICKKCNYVFHYRGMRLHIKRHENLNITPADIIIIPFNDNIRPGEKTIRLSKCFKCQRKYPAHLIASHTCYNPNLIPKPTKTIPTMTLYRCVVCKKMFSDKAKHLKECISQNSQCKCSLGIHKHHIYKCRRCNLYMLSFGASKYHLYSKQHKESSLFKRCQICGWKFTEYSLKKHIIEHHKRLQLIPDDFCIIAIDRNYVPLFGKSNKEQIKKPRIEKPLAIETNNIVEIQEPKKKRENVLERIRLKMEAQYPNEPKEEDRYEKMKENPIYNKYKSYRKTLFRCSCGIHFMDIRSWIMHNEKNHSSTRLVNVCTHCGLKFSSGSLSYHKAAHRKGRVDFKVVVPDISMYEEPKRMDPSDGNNVDIATTSSIDANINESVVSQSSLDAEQNVKDSDQISAECNKTVPIKRSASPDSSSADKFFHKIYKCAQCKVCFMSQSSCYSHMLNHTPLDAMEYINCKMCNLPFKIMSLASHIKKHHKAAFNLNEVLVEEYSLDGGRTPKIEIYYAADKEQSRLVSTTSDGPSCDTDNNQDPPTSSSVIDAAVDSVESVEGKVSDGSPKQKDEEVYRIEIDKPTESDDSVGNEEVLTTAVDKHEKNQFFEMFKIDTPMDVEVNCDI